MLGILLDNLDFGDGIEIRAIAGAGIVFDRMVPIIIRDGCLHGSAGSETRVRHHSRRETSATRQREH